MHTPSLLADALYWLFLILWSLMGAYLMVVRQVQNTIARSLKNIFFGEINTEHPQVDEHPPRLFRAPHASHGEHDAPMEPSHAIIHPESSNDLIDDFIVQQLARTK